jgi:hypothetical protein
MQRDNFSKRTIEILAKRVGYLCSNPNCQKETVGPSSIFDKSINIGVAAHITAASEMGPRYDKSLDSEQRKSISNAIWLCQSCSVLIDRDPNKYSTELLRSWKSYSEKLAISKLESKEDNISIENTIQEIEVSKDFVSFINSTEKGLICQIEHADLKEQIILDYHPIADEWNSNESHLDWNSPYHFVINSLKSEINKIIKKGKNEEINGFIESVKNAIQVNGIIGMIEYLFDRANLHFGIPPFKNFMKAFNIYIKNEKHDYIPLVFGNSIYMNNRNKEYLIHTDIGRTTDLDTYFSNESLEEITVMTNNAIWDEILFDPGIDKTDFIPSLLELWENYWDEQLNSKDLTKQEYSDKKEKSWRSFQLFDSEYNHIQEVLGYAFSLDPEVLYPLAVMVMIENYGKEICFNEYCEFEFSDGWEAISLDNFTEDINTFYIKISEK